MTETYREHRIWVWSHSDGWQYHEHTNTLQGLWQTVRACRERGETITYQSHQTI